MGIEVRNAVAGDIPAISVTLAKAFADDPVKLFLVGGKQLPIARVTPFFTAFMDIQLPHGLVFTTAGYEAASIWAPPGQWKIPDTQVVRKLPTFLRLYGWRLPRNLGVLTALEKRHPKEPHYYLEFIGTAPEHQGKGAGSSMISPMLERADDEGVGMYLESSKESNVPFYSRFGFKVTSTITHKHNGPTMWLMWRDPR
jgi:ribosomal protein S18 acetylase RimI-like enzyme